MSTPAVESRRVWASSGLDDAPHELVADDVRAAEAHDCDALDRVEDVADDDQPGAPLAGRSTWVMSPVTTIFEP